MLIVGLTGAIGSGKSLVGQYFAQLGALVLDADILAREALERGSTGFDAVIQLFGDSILRDGDIDRALLGDVVFNDVDSRKKLEAIVHPIVKKSFENAVSQLGPQEIMIYEIPLLFETQSANRFDYVITVESAEPIRQGRLMERGMRATQIAARNSAQATAQERASIADYVIINDGSADDLLREVERIWAMVLPPLQRERS